jgi:hypothetical protein
MDYKKEERLYEGFSTASLVRFLEVMEGKINSATIIFIVEALIVVVCAIAKLPKLAIFITGLTFGSWYPVHYFSQIHNALIQRTINKYKEVRTK